MTRKARRPGAAQPPTTAAAPHAPPSFAPADRHGPRGPRVQRYGLDRLREALRLSSEVPLEEVCEDAALELERLREVEASARRRGLLEPPSIPGSW